MCIRDRNVPNVPFDNDELEWVKKANETKTSDDVLNLAIELQEWMKANQKETESDDMFKLDIAMPDEKSEDTDGENSESDDSNSSEDGDQESDDTDGDSDSDSKPVDPTQRQEDETYSEYQDRLEKLAEEEIIKKTLLSLGAEKIKLNGFLNKSISGDEDIFNKTIGVEYSY